MPDALDWGITSAEEMIGWKKYKSDLEREFRTLDSYTR